MRLQKIIFPAVVVILMITSCTKQKAVFLEPVKDLNAIWRINNVTRNETDITQYIDSAGFRLKLSSDHSFTLEGNNIPFLVNAGKGTWFVDDPQYPNNITFKPSDSTNSFSGKVATPVNNGKRTLSITFSPGCRSNGYIYTFEKVY